MQGDGEAAFCLSEVVSIGFAHISAHGAVSAALQCSADPRLSDHAIQESRGEGPSSHVPVVHKIGRKFPCFPDYQG